MSIADAHAAGWSGLRAQPVLRLPACGDGMSGGRGGLGERSGE